MSSGFPSTHSSDASLPPSSPKCHASLNEVWPRQALDEHIESFLSLNKCVLSFGQFSSPMLYVSTDKDIRLNRKILKYLLEIDDPE